MRGKISRNSKERGRKENVSRMGKCRFLKKILQKTGDQYIVASVQTSSLLLREGGRLYTG